MIGVIAPHIQAVTAWQQSAHVPDEAFRWLVTMDMINGVTFTSVICLAGWESINGRAMLMAAQARLRRNPRAAQIASEEEALDESNQIGTNPISTGLTIEWTAVDEPGVWRGEAAVPPPVDRSVFNNLFRESPLPRDSDERVILDYGISRGFFGRMPETDRATLAHSIRTNSPRLSRLLDELQLQLQMPSRPVPDGEGDPFARDRMIEQIMQFVGDHHRAELEQMPTSILIGLRHDTQAALIAEMTRSHQAAARHHIALETADRAFRELRDRLNPPESAPQEPPAPAPRPRVRPTLPLRDNFRETMLEAQNQAEMRRAMGRRPRRPPG